MTSGFEALFNRSRYRHPQLGGMEDERMREQRERFIVAATAFCIKHDQTFCGDFFRLATGLTVDSSELKALQIQIEPHKESDLVIVLPDRCAVVVEFKINASLKEHQNPASPNFSAEYGYGDWLTTQFRVEKGDLIYVLLDQSAEQINGCSEINERKLEFRQLKWSDVAETLWDSSSLRQDYFDCCAALGVKAMTPQKIKNTKIDISLLSACDAIQLLDRVIYELDIELRKGCKLMADPGQNDSTWSLGYELYRLEEEKRYAHAFQRKLAEKCNHPDASAWFGFEYYVDTPGKQGAVVYLWTKDRESSERVAKIYERNINFFTKILPGGSGEWNGVRLEPSSKVGGDFDWFIEALTIAASENSEDLAILGSK